MPANMTVPNRPHTIRQAAAVLGISYRALEDTLHRGEIPSYKIGGARRIRPDVLEAILAGRDPWTVVTPATMDGPPADDPSGA